MTSPLLKEKSCNFIFGATKLFQEVELGPSGGLQGIKFTGIKEGHLGLPGASADVGTLEEREIHQHL